jgi:DNA invertase Pin-like site-specific DNA recombinase
MKINAYIRISGDIQDLERQKTAILEFTQKKGIIIDRFIYSDISSRKLKREKRIEMLIQQLEPEDTLIVSELRQIGRSIGEVIAAVDSLVRKNIRFLAIKEDFYLNGVRNLETKTISDAFRLLAKLEKEIISNQTKDSLTGEKASGRKPGRPKGSLGKSKLDGKEEEIKRLLKLGVSKSSIAKIVDVNRGTLYHFIKSRKLA